MTGPAAPPLWTEHQLPAGDEVFLDHVGWFVPDLDEAAAALRRLGFAVSPVNVHMNQGPEGAVPSGTSNRLVMLGLGYLEFLAASGDAPLARQHAAQLARYQGLHLLAFNSANVPGEARRLAAEGFRPFEPVDMRRPVQTSRGPVEGRFQVLRVPPNAMAEGRVQWCAHLTPELVWEAGGTGHANGAEALTGALWIVGDVDEALARYARFLRKPATAPGADAGCIALERGTLAFATAEAAARLVPGVEAPTAPPFGAAVGVRLADLAAAARHLRQAGVPFRESGGRLLLAPPEALGAWLVLHEGAQPFSQP